MRQRPIVVAIMLCCLLASTAFAAPPAHDAPINWGVQINGQCASDGDLLVNVTMQITNDIDSAVGGGFWAIDSFNKTIQIWTTPDAAVYCARVMYLGKFVAVKGTSPQGSGSLAGGEKGSFEGGYWATITGTLSATPAWQTNGNVGVFNFGCNPSTGVCSNAFSWLDQYFSSISDFAYNWWGWTYHGGKNGTWNNVSTGNSGDIRDQ